MLYTTVEVNVIYFSTYNLDKSTVLQIGNCNLELVVCTILVHNHITYQYIHRHISIFIGIAVYS